MGIYKGAAVKINISEKENVVIISVDSSVLQEHIPRLKERLNNIISQNKNWLVFDLVNAEYLSSLGISVLISTKRKVNNSGGEMVLANVNHLIKNLFKVTNLLDKVEIYNNVDEAVNALKQVIQ